MGLLLFFVALLPTIMLTAVWAPIAIIYYLVTLKWKIGINEFLKYFYKMAHSIDQFANVSLQIPLRYLLLYKDGPFHPFGDEDDTISYVIAKNQELNALNWFGRFWAKFLDTVDTDHLAKAVKYKFERDMEAFKRITKKADEN